VHANVMNCSLEALSDAEAVMDVWLAEAAKAIKQVWVLSYNMLIHRFQRFPDMKQVLKCLCAECLVMSIRLSYLFKLKLKEILSHAPSAADPCLPTRLPSTSC